MKNQRACKHCGAHLSRYNNGPEGICGPCTKAATDRMLASGLALKGTPHREAVDPEMRRQSIRRALEVASPLTLNQLAIATGMTYAAVHEQVRRMALDGEVEVARREGRFPYWQLVTDVESLMQETG